MAVPDPNSERSGNEVGNFTPAHLGSFRPALTLDGFDDKILPLRPWHDGARDPGPLAEMYGQVSPDLISQVTDAVLDEVRAWQSRPLEPIYPVVFLRRAAGQNPRRRRGQEQGGLPGAGRIRRRPEGRAGLWIEQTEGAKFWLKVFNELKTRGFEDILIAVVDGLKGLPEAIDDGVPADHRADLHRPSDP